MCPFDSSSFVEEGNTRIGLPCCSAEGPGRRKEKKERKGKEGISLLENCTSNYVPLAGCNGMECHGCAGKKQELCEETTTRIGY